MNDRQTTDHRIMNRLAHIGCAAIAAVALATTARAGNYTWSGAAGADWTNAANWSPAGFANATADVCTVNSGGNPRVRSNGSSFAAQLNLNSGAVLDSSGYNYNWYVTNLVLNGGSCRPSSSETAQGNVTVTANSSLVGAGGDNCTISFSISGSGNLSFTNQQPGGRSTSINGNNVNYSGIWTINNTTPGGITFNTASAGTGGLTFPPAASNVSFNTSTACPWDLDVRGKTISLGSQNYTHSGQITVRSPVLLAYAGDYGGKNVTFNGKVTGTGKISTYVNPGHTTCMVVFNNSTNDFSGGLEVLPYPAVACQGAAKGSLGTGAVHVDTNATLQAAVSGVMTNTADIYIDGYGTSYGKLNMASASITTTVGRAFVGGTGGWESPLGYTQLSPGNYTSANLPNYISGSGTLAVVPVVTAGLPLILNTIVSNVTTTSATLIGSLTTNGGATATVALYWGTTDGSTNLNTWAHTNAFAAGQWNSGDSPTTNITALLANNNYYATFAATTAGGTSVATPSLKFISGQLALTVTDGTCGANGADTATVMVTRPAACTNETSFVNYTTSGGAVAGTDYSIAPISGAVQIPAGQTNATVTITPIFPPFNYGAPKSIVVSLAPGAYAIGAGSNATCSLATLVPGTYTWIGPASADWLVATNWSPDGFVNGTGDVCSVNSGAQPKVAYVSTFYAQLNLNAGAILGANNSATFSNLHLRGGTIVLGGGNSYGGIATVESNSTIVSGTGYNDTLWMIFSGTGNLSVTNLQAGANNGTSFTGANTNYSGIWNCYNPGGTTIGFSGDPGTGGFYLGPAGYNVSLNYNTHCPVSLDLQGGAIYVCGNAAPQNLTQSGTFTLLSDSILDGTPDGWGKHAYLTGQITGPGRLLSRLTATGGANGSESLILTNSLNNYSGGTLVLSNWLEAATANAMGTGNVEVQPGGKLRAVVSGTISRSSKLYLDRSGGVSGLLDLGGSTGVVTTVAQAFVGGTGGWKSPSGYTQLSPGSYTNGSAAVSGYVTNSGVLKVLAPSGFMLFLR